MRHSVIFFLYLQMMYSMKLLNRIAILVKYLWQNIQLCSKLRPHYISLQNIYYAPLMSFSLGVHYYYQLLCPLSKLSRVDLMHF